MIDGPLSMFVAEQRIGPMIQQEPDDVDVALITSQIQGRLSIIVLDVDITSQGEETINSLKAAIP